VHLALTPTVGLVLAPPQVAMAVGTAAAGKHIGLSGRAHLPFESFGADRHPEVDLHQVQGIEFAYKVIPVR
jgi:hypothetical protein